jgi:hypothetical protein
MKKLILSVVAAVAIATPALAADLKFKAPPPPPPPNPWDVAFGAGIQSDYIFRAITQSNHKPSVNAYFEPRYNITPYLQLYAGVAGSSISFPNRAAAEVDGTVGIRPTFSPLALDFGGIVYWYRVAAASTVAPTGVRRGLPRNLPSGQRQRHQGPDLLGGAARHLHGQRLGRVLGQVATHRQCSIRA